MLDNLYREEILEHYKNPLNFGRLKNFDISSKLSNPFCGDEIEIFIKFEKEKISEIGFSGNGCAISVAATSMLTKYVKGKIKKQLTKFMEKDMLNLLNIQVSNTRKKCALLGWAALKNCLK